MAEKLEIWIKHEGESVQLPFVELGGTVTRDSNDNVINLYAAGDRLIRGNVGLMEFAYSSHIPDSEKQYAYIDNMNYPSPYDFAKTIKKWQESDKNIRLIITQTEINFPGRITSFNYREEDQTGSLFYDITITECPPIDTKKEAKAGEYEKAERRPRNAEVKQDTIKMNLGWEEK